MCGIVGGVGQLAPNRLLLESQLQALRHRGPDDIGTFFDAEISLGMCRLSIVEIQSGRQPASDESKQITIVWNGEIYNYRELRQWLESKGKRFRNSSESEVIINLYLEFGKEFVSYLNGMFAIAIYDARVKSLHLLRDRLGKKPLWFTTSKESSLSFASEIRALMLAVPNLTLRKEMISEVMQFGYIRYPNSTFHEVEQVPPAHILTWSNDSLSFTRYWEPDFSKKTYCSYPDALEETKRKIRDAVQRRLISERPIGSFLSGGIDSTIVTAYMAQLMNRKVKTFTIGFKNQDFNEAGYARGVANYLETDHREEFIVPDPKLILEEIAHSLDQPLADSSIIPTYLLAKFARESVIVALGGDGGDEVFGGYDRYIATPILNHLNPFLGLAKFGIPLIERRVIGKSRKINRATKQLTYIPSLSQRFVSVHSLAQRNEMVDLLNPELLSLDSESRFVKEFEYGDLTPLNRMIRSDLTSYLPGDLLVKADIASMSNSLELRSPLLDVEVVEWGISLPKSYKVRGLVGKRILKDVAYSLVPKELVDRPKMGFGVPRADWLRGELKEMVMDLLTDKTASQRHWFNQVKVKSILDDHFQGLNRDNLIWPMLILELWARNWLDKVQEKPRDNSR